MISNHFKDTHSLFLRGNNHIRLTFTIKVKQVIFNGFCQFIGILFVVVRALMFGDPTSGWPSMVCIILLCSGVQLFCTGIVGEYLAKTYLEVKHRPIYIVAETEEDKK